VKRYLRYLFLLSGLGILISGIYFWSICPFINALFPPIEFWNPPQALLLVAAPHRIPRDAGDIVTGLAIFTLGFLTIREPSRRAYLKSIAALAALAVVFDLLGGLYALSAQLGLYLSLALLRKQADAGNLL